MEVKGLIIFGSAVNNEFDDNSDLDICVISKNGIIEQFISEKLNELGIVLPKNKIEIVRYNESQLKQMLAKGSLFLHHLKNEGKILYGHSYIKKQFEKLKKFNSHLEELEYYIEIFDQLIKSRQNENENENENQMFDGSLLFTITRNICILISNFYGEHKYGRRNAFEFCSSNLEKFPLSNSDYSTLESMKLNYERGVKIELETSQINLSGIIPQVIELLSYSKLLFESENEILALQSKIKNIRNLSDFGFKERMNLEKTLFSILTKVARGNVSGFNQVEFDKLNNIHSDDFNRLMIIRKLFELRKFLKEISAGSAYVRDLALENADTNRKEVFNLLEIQIRGIRKEIKRLSLINKSENRLTAKALRSGVGQKQR